MYVALFDTMQQNYGSLHKRNTPLVGVFAVGRQKNAPESGKPEKSFPVTDEKNVRKPFNVSKSNFQPCCHFLGKTA